MNDQNVKYTHFNDDDKEEEAAEENEADCVNASEINAINVAQSKEKKYITKIELQRFLQC